MGFGIKLSMLNNKHNKQKERRSANTKTLQIRKEGKFYLILLRENQNWNKSPGCLRKRGSIWMHLKTETTK